MFEAFIGMLGGYVSLIASAQLIDLVGGNRNER